MPFAREGLEMRSTRRFRMRLPVEMQSAAGQERKQECLTRDVSWRGVCFYFDGDLEVGSAIEFLLTLPAEVTLAESIRVRCTGTVVRVERPPAPSVKTLIAATILRYEYLGREVSD